jgi:hypothetical protein
MAVALDSAPYPPALRGWLDAHARLRRDAEALYNAVINLDPADRLGATQLAGSFGTTARMVRAHHRFEDNVLFPTAAERDPAFASDVMVLSLGHVDVDDVVEDMSRTLAVLAGGTTRSLEVWQRLVHNAKTLRELLVEQLAIEEARALPVLMRTFATARRPSAAA